MKVLEAEDKCYQTSRLKIVNKDLEGRWPDSKATQGG